jgi:hypothetical protein
MNNPQFQLGVGENFRDSPYGFMRANEKLSGKKIYFFRIPLPNLYEKNMGLSASPISYGNFSGRTGT